MKPAEPILWWLEILAAIVVLGILLASALAEAPPLLKSEHVALGQPANDGLLLDKPQYVVSYNDKSGGPVWVAWRLAKEWLGHQDRQDDFRGDDGLPSLWYHVTYADYSGSGFDAGHQCPSADRTRTIADNQSTFLMTNMLPQAPHLNRGPWKGLEGHCRDLANEGNELYIVAGPSGVGGHGANGFRSRIADKHVTVPASCWKVAVVLEDRKGDDLSRVTKATPTLAVVMPNTQAVEQDWTTYKTTVREVEELTGLDFFGAVPKAIQDAIEVGK